MVKSPSRDSLGTLLQVRNEQEYIQVRELTLPNLELPKYAIKMGTDGNLYAVFSDGYDAFEFDLLVPDAFVGCNLACFGEYENAYHIGIIH